MYQWYLQSSSYQDFFSNVSCLISWPKWNAELHETVFEDLKPGYSEDNRQNISINMLDFKNKFYDFTHILQRCILKMLFSPSTTVIPQQTYLKKSFPR